MGIINQLWDLIAAVIAFLVIFVLSMRVKELRESMRSRTRTQWLIDLLGLFVQGWVVPLAKIYGLLILLQMMIGNYQGRLDIPAWLSFLLAFVGVDYLYYWNHRLLHSDFFWPLHRLHHSTQNLDLFSSARNSVITPLFIVYIWIHSIMAFVLKDPMAYILGATLTSILDLWRHSKGLEFAEDWNRRLSRLVVTPSDHSWHHSLAGMRKNFGANLSIWDRLHGTYQVFNSKKAKIGWNEQSSVWRQLFFPWIKHGETDHV